jgi:hypothetical protein
LSPLQDQDLAAFFNATGHDEGTSEHTALEKEMGFSYRTLLGEILYAYVITRPDIGYPITFARQV